MVEDDKSVCQSLAHALLSPLTVILGSLDMLLNKETAWPDYVVEVMELALAQAQRLHETLDALIATAEVQDNMVQLSWSLPVPHANTQPGERPAEPPETAEHEEPM